MSSLKALKTLTLGKNKLKKMPDKELQGDSAFDTTWMLTPREIRLARRIIFRRKAPRS